MKKLSFSYILFKKITLIILIFNCFLKYMAYPRTYNINIVIDNKYRHMNYELLKLKKHREQLILYYNKTNPFRLF